MQHTSVFDQARLPVLPVVGLDSLQPQLRWRYAQPHPADSATPQGLRRAMQSG